MQVSLENVRELVVKQLLLLCSGGNEDKFLICLNKIQINFPHLVSRYVCSSVFPKGGKGAAPPSNCVPAAHDSSKG